MANRLDRRSDNAAPEADLRDELEDSFGAPDRRFEAAQGTEVIFYKAMAYTVGPADISGADQ